MGIAQATGSKLPSRERRPRRVLVGALVLLLGGLALAAPFVAPKAAPFILGLLMLGSGALETAFAFLARDRNVGNSAFLSSVMSVAAGGLLIAQPKLALGALAVLLGLSFAIDGAGKIIAAVRGREKSGGLPLLLDGLFAVALGAFIAGQWPVSGIIVIGLSVGLRILSSGWAMMLGRADAPSITEAEAARLHPDTRLGIPPHDQIAKLRDEAGVESEARGRIDRYWRITFLATFFAIHIGRMDAGWHLVGLISPAVAVAGDVVFALLLTWAVVTPARLLWRRLTRPFERRAWNRYLAATDQRQTPTARGRVVRRWLSERFRFDLQLERCRRSPTAAFARGLQVGLPLAAVLIALNPIWGFSWYFNTENWATEVWNRWAEERTDTWRAAMFQSVRENYQDENIPEDRLFRVEPEGVAGAADFSFIVIGDTGEGDASQFCLKDQLLDLGRRPDIKFLVLSSDVVYPTGAMADYEPKFYLPFKGFSKPIYAIPGNHDWYDALEAFAANFLEPKAARASIRARIEVDKRLTSTTDAHADHLIQEAARLRQVFGVSTGWQRGPFFEIQTDRFALIAVDTGVQRRVDELELAWMKEALARSKGKFTMAVLGHPLYAGGHYQASEDVGFATLHRLVQEHGVQVVMAGDTHYFEYYREPDPAGGARVAHHFVNGGGGAYMSVGTSLDWPTKPPVPDCAFFPRTDAVIAKIDGETPPWKRPFWFWVRRLGAWPSTREGMAGLFDYNHAPFFQSFVEVKVEGSANRVRLIPHGANGPLHWRDLQLIGQVLPAGRSEDDAVEFVIPLAGGNPS